MGMLYRPKYRNAAGELVESSIWWFKIYVNGKPVRVNTKTANRKAAKDQMAVRAAEAAQNLPIVPKLNTKTVADILADVVIDYENKKQDTAGKVRQMIRDHLAPAFGNWNAASVADDQVQQYIAERLKAGAQRSTINRELCALKRAYKLNERVVTVRPAIPIAKEKNARKGFFERDAFERVRAALPAELQPILTVAYITGWRINSELLPMEWRQVDFAARCIRLDPGTTKNDQAREFPFCVELEDTLRRQREYSDRVARERGVVVRHVFHRDDGRRVKYWRRPWLQALVKSGLAVRQAHEDGTPNPRGKIIPGVIPHDFRRTAIRNLARSGVSEAIAMRLCGHETRSVFDRYNVVTGDDLREAVARLDERTATAAT